MRDITAILAQLLVWLVVAAGAVALGLGRWTIAKFGYVTPDQALMNMRGAGGEGAGGATLMTSLAIEVLLIPLTLTLLLFVAVQAGRSTMRKKPGTVRGARIGATAAVVTVMMTVPIAGAWSLGSAVQFRQYLAARDPSLDIGAFYTPPSVTSSSSDTTHNLVLIYGESIEDAFANDQVFEINMLEELDDSTEGWAQIPALEQYEGGGWTMSGIVSTQCGIPLRAPSSVETSGTTTTEQSRPMKQWSGDAYLPGAVCLGDVLAARDYTNVYLGGAHADFADKGTFLTTHGYDTVKDLQVWREKGETEINGDWGLSDRRLLAHAKKELVKLREAGKPFNLTLLTLDTHEPVHFFDYCDATTEDDLTSVTRCSMDMVADFVAFMEEEGFLEDTAVVIVGDHLKFTAQTNGFYQELTSYPDRTIVNRISTPDDRIIAVDRADQLDMYPTILEAMGIDLVGNRAGLGVSAFVPSSPEWSLRSLTEEDRRALVSSRSQEFYDLMWTSTASG